MPETTPQKLNRLWKALLAEYPDGVSNTSTTKYNDIRTLLADLLQVPIDEVYATGAKTRTSNLDTRFVQGNQAGRHTKIGVAFMQTETAIDVAGVERLSDSAVVTSRKFVDGSDNTRYDSILIFVEQTGELFLTRVIQPASGGYYDLLKPHFVKAQLVTVGGTGAALTHSGSSPCGVTGSVTASMPELVEKFMASCSDAKLVVQSSTVLRFASSLLSKRFLILTGLAGSGKTKLAQAFARWITPDPSWVDAGDPLKGKNPNFHYALVAVGADWTGNENIVGYPDGLRPPKMKSDGSVLEPGSYVAKPALELVLHARDHKDVPHFLVLDEMNLSHVERYFADLLSLIESEESMALYCDKKGADGKPENTRGLDPVLKLSNNLFIIGTVNVDETTYMFSPKVLDRANVIEFRVEADEMKAFLADPKKPDLERLAGKGAAFGPGFVAAARDQAVTISAEPKDIKPRFEAEMNFFFALQREHGSEYGFRVAHEAARFLHFYKVLGDGKIWEVAANGGKGAWVVEDAAKRDWLDAAFDALVIQKFLPKLHGSKVKLGPLLKKVYTASVQPHDPAPRDAKALLAKLAEPAREIPKDARYPVTAEKVSRMWRQLNENGFTSFPEN